MFSIPGALKERIRSAERVTFFTGAGISAESGIPTFRGAGGLWKKFKPEELASFDAFIKNPDIVWEWYQYRRKIIEEAKPNAGHTAIREFEKHFTEVTVITQNVDNLHRRAGSTDIYELHGNIEKNYCLGCNKRFDYIHFTDTVSVPRCACGGLIRPDVVWFGEMLPPAAFAASERISDNSDIFFVVGTSAIVYPAAFLPIGAKRHGAYLIEINVEKTELSETAHCSFEGKAGEILPLLLEEMIKIKHA